MQFSPRASWWGGWQATAHKLVYLQCWVGDSLSDSMNTSLLNCCRWQSNNDNNNNNKQTETALHILYMLRKVSNTGLE